MPPIHVTLLDLTTHEARQLARANDPAGGTVVVKVRPDTRRAGWLARDLLAAVGIRHDLTFRRHRDADDRQLAPLWLAAHGIRDVIVVGIEALRADLVPELIDLAALADASLWLVADHVIPDALAEVVADWPMQPCPPATFRERWPVAPSKRHYETSAVSPTLDNLERLPAVVPQVEFPVFRATAYRQLSRAEFEAVDDRFLTELHNALERLAAGADPVEVLRDALARCQSPTAVTVTVRAVQVAAFREGAHLKVDIPTLLAVDDHAPVAAAADSSTWATLNGYRQPLRQATCALTVLGIALSEQQELRLTDLDPDCQAIRSGDRWISIPPPAWPAFHALLLSRRAAGASDNDALLAHLDGTPITMRSLANLVSAVQRETGLRLIVGQIERRPTPTRAWASRRRVSATSWKDAA